MKKFILKIFLFAIIIGVAATILNFFIFPNDINPYSYKYNLLKDKNIEVIISGNSHLEFGIIADSLSFNAVNIANKARELDTDIDILVHHIQNKAKLKVVLVPISYYSLFRALDTKTSYGKTQKRLYYNYYKLKDYNQGIIENSLLINEPFKELIQNISIFSNFQKSEFSKKGWRANNNIFSADSTILGKLKSVERYLKDTMTINYNINKLHQLIKITKRNQISLYLVLPPYSSYYFNITKGKHNAIIDSILNKNFENEKYVKIINSNDFMPINLKYYENSDHLNVKGARLYTEKIDSILKIDL